MPLENEIEKLYQKQTGYSEKDYQIFLEFRSKLEEGTIRAAERINNRWQTNIWVKKGILTGFRMGIIADMVWSDTKSFLDKHTYPERRFDKKDSIRIVPGGSSVRSGAYIGKNVTIMPPSYVNVGAYIDDGTMLDSHSLVGSCAQIGKQVHLSASAIVGGVLEPVGSNPVIIEDEAFIGGNCGIYEGVLIKAKAILAAGVVLTSSTKVYDAVNKRFLMADAGIPLTIPEQGVVIPGSRALRGHDGISVSCPVIIKYRDEKTESSVSLEELLR